MNESLKTLLTQTIRQAPSADNSQPWKITWKNNSLSIEYDANRVSRQTFPPDNPATLLSIGAAIENLHQAVDGLGLKITAQTRPAFISNTPVYYKAVITAPEQTVKFTDTDLPLFQRHTNRHPFQSKAIEDNQLKLLKKLTVGPHSIRVLNDRADVLATSQLVRKASEIRFRIREINEWLGKSLRFGAEAEQRCDGLDVATLNLPPGGALFLRLTSDWRRMEWLNRLGAYKLMSFIESQPIKNSPALVAITGPEGFKESLEAGRLMQRAWIELNSRGIAVQPYFVISDQINRLQEKTIPDNLINEAKLIEKQATQLFNLNEGEVLHMLFRIGYPTKAAKRSLRLPLEKISNMR